MEIDPQLACEIVRNIGQLCFKEQFIDLQINIDNHQFRFNRFVLCAFSELFKSLLQPEVKGEHLVKEVTVSGISKRTFQLILSAIYKGVNGLNTNNMMAFWHAVHELQIPVLVSKCETFVSSHITQMNFLQIYTRAHFWNSEKIIKMVHTFLAKNFENFTECQFFLQLPSKTMQEILSSQNLNVTTPDILVEFILRWVSHEPFEDETGTWCAGDSSDVKDTNVASDQRLVHSPVIKDKNGGVEVILHQPSDALLESCLQAHCLTETTFARKESLGKLLRLFPLSEASRDCLEMLADADIIMGVKETRDMVKQALETHRKVQKYVNKKVLPSNSMVTTAELSKNEQVVIFEKNNAVYAFSIDRNKLFCFTLHRQSLLCRLVSIYTVNNCIFMTTADLLGSNMTLTAATFPFSDRNITAFYHVGSCSAIVGDFCYTFKDSGLYRQRCNGERNWFQLIDFGREIDVVLVNIFRGNIVFYCQPDYYICMYCFNIETRRCWSIMKLDFGSNIISFIHNNQLYVLRNDGCIWNISNDVDFPRTDLFDGNFRNLSLLFPVNVHSAIVSTCVQQQKLWEGTCKLVGAVVSYGRLLIFADLNCLASSSLYSNTIPGIIPGIIPGVYEIKFIHLNSQTKCHPLVVPSSMLIEEV